jgi:hypothetical protein
MNKSNVICIKECIGKVESLPAYATNLSAKGLRYGGTQEIQIHINAGSLAAVLRGGWALDEKET